MIYAPIFFIAGIIAIISSLSPLFEIAKTISSGLIIPKSPCNPSVEFINILVVPVEAKVADIFLPIIPVFPIPVTTTFPLQSYIFLTTLTKFSDNLFILNSNDLISVS